jgi:hypothetical protein
MGDQAERKRFLERPIAVVTLVGGVLGAIATAVGLMAAKGDSEPELAGNTRSTSYTTQTMPYTTQTTTDRTALCMTQHGMSKSIEKKQVVAGRVLFSSCSWPPPQGATSEGYAEIAVASEAGPGQSEAEGLTVADVFSTQCPTLSVKYLFNNQGTFQAEAPFQLNEFQVLRVEDGSTWQPASNAEREQYRALTDTAIVLSNSRYILDAARCV